MLHYSYWGNDKEGPWKMDASGVPGPGQGSSWVCLDSKFIPVYWGKEFWFTSSETQENISWTQSETSSKRTRKLTQEEASPSGSQLFLEGSLTNETMTPQLHQTTIAETELFCSRTWHCSWRLWDWCHCCGLIFRPPESKHRETEHRQLSQSSNENIKLDQ